MKKTFQLNAKGKPPVPFVVPKEGTYKVVPLGYVSKTGEQFFDPLDLERVTILKKGELLDGTKIFMAENGCDCGVNIEIQESYLI